MDFYPLTQAQVYSVPKHSHHTPQNHLTPLLREFLNSGAEAARLDFFPDEYNSIHSAYASLYRSIQYSNFPIHLEIRSGWMYLIRTDISSTTTPTQEAE